MSNTKYRKILFLFSILQQRPEDVVLAAISRNSFRNPPSIGDKDIAIKFVENGPQGLRNFIS